MNYCIWYSGKIKPIYWNMPFGIKTWACLSKYLQIKLMGLGKVRKFRKKKKNKRVVNIQIRQGIKSETNL